MQNLSAKYGKTLNLDKLTSYCPGCGHGIVTRLVAEAIETLGIRERAIAIVGIGCGGHGVVHGVAAQGQAGGAGVALVHTAASRRKVSTLTASSPWLSSQKR